MAAMGGKTGMSPPIPTVRRGASSAVRGEAAKTLAARPQILSKMSKLTAQRELSWAPMVKGQKGRLVELVRAWRGE